MIQDVLVEPTAKLDISLLLKSSPSPPPRPTPSAVTSPPFSRATTITGETPAPQASNVPVVSSTARSQYPVPTVPLQSYSQRQSASHAASVPTGQATAAQRSTGGKRPLPKQATSSGSPAKKSNRKWTIEEDEVLTELRGQGKKWEDISHHIPDRSDIACRLHFQNYVEKRPAWDEAKKDTLAMMYERYVLPVAEGGWSKTPRRGPPLCATNRDCSGLTRTAGAKRICGKTLRMS